MVEHTAQIEEFPAPEQSVSRRKVPWLSIAAALVAVAVLAGAGYLAAPGITVGRLIEGTASANPAGVAAAASERKAAEDAAAAQKKKADDEAFIVSLEAQVKDSMQRHFDEAADDLGVQITILDVALVKTAENKFEGMADMKAGYRSPHAVDIHVTADDRTMMWETDQGALLALFR
jgi:hypothetical protein